MQVHLVQLDIVWNQKSINFERAAHMLASASLAPGDLVIFPEMFATGFMHHPEKGVAENFKEENEETNQFLSQVAADFHVVVSGGGIAQLETSKNDSEIQKDVQNYTGIFYPGDKTPRVSYSKIHLFPSEQRRFMSGSQIVLFDWNGLRVAPFTCYDLRFPELFREAVSKGAEAFAVCASWPAIRAPHWETLLRARAIENQAFVFGVNRVGRDPYAAYDGGSAVYSPEGVLLTHGDSSEQILSAEIDVALPRKYRQEFPVLRDAGLL